MAAPIETHVYLSHLRGYLLFDHHQYVFYDHGKCHRGIAIFKIKFKMAAPKGTHVYLFHLGERLLKF